MPDVAELQDEIARLKRRVAELEQGRARPAKVRDWAPDVEISDELELLFSELSDYVWSAQILDDGSFKYRYYSPAVEKITGRPPSFYLEGGWLSTIHPDDRPQMLETAKRLLSSPEPVVEERYRIVLPDGRERWVRDRVVRAQRGDGTVVLHGIVRDVTDEVHAEIRSMTLQDQMQRTQRLESLGLLAGGVAHDFNNLLVGVLGSIDLALTTLPRDTPARVDLRRAEASASRCADLCQQLLAYSGKGNFVVEPVSLARLVEDMGQLLEISIAKTHPIRYELDSQVPPITGDQGQLRQVVMNLIANASEAIGNRGGNIILRVQLREASATELASTRAGVPLEPGPYVCLEVEDTGEGMDQARLEQIFDPFFTTKAGGHGLGLAAALGIVRGHGGAIWVTSEPRRGTCFRLLFPPSNTAAAEAKQAKPATSTTTGAGQRTGTVLVADDNPAVRKVSQRLLALRGFDVVLANDGAEAVELYEQRGPEFCFVLLDMSMPRLDGLSALAAIKARDPEAKVVMMSGYNESTLEAELAHHRHVAFMKKPFRKAVLDEMIETMLGEAEPG